MQSARTSIFLAAGLVACSSNGASGGGDADDGTGSGAGSSGVFEPGAPHTPATGCEPGYTACGTVCAHLEDDARHCGACDAACAGGSCAAGQCAEDGYCMYKPICDGACVSASWNADHCGSCSNACADDALCVENACVDAGGDGTSCDSPLFWNVEEEEDAGFRMSPSVTVTHTFQCGPLEAIPTRWFRYTAPEDDAKVEVRTEGPDDYVLEVYADPSCAMAHLLGCNDQESGTDMDPELKPVTQAGKTYWVAVGLKGSWSGQPAALRVDH